jgi:hypothetical protein
MSELVFAILGVCIARLSALAPVLWHAQESQQPDDRHNNIETKNDEQSEINNYQINTL